MAFDTPPALRQLVYSSMATKPNTPEALEDLLMACRPRNRGVQVTGLLLACPDRFMQCLEGPAPAIAETYARIQRDPRHHSLDLVLDHVVYERTFTGWDMACTAVGDSPWLARSNAMWEDHKDMVEVTSPGFLLLKRVWESRCAAFR